jgi:hypothetical protein
MALFCKYSIKKQHEGKLFSMERPAVYFVQFMQSCGQHAFAYLSNNEALNTPLNSDKNYCSEK